ncbi:uncharacterized protein LTR77_007162 [Saxophila tyrrhenica]|uniref:Alcohol dehydrogenase n=1 Tax=Saxophila tyrrhenica TaxID=1690608 RepID=A0AAV9P4P1_9PEZI|nr:hypothetical protein LTR77_007162 [Saxophila tyrrhenica]
MAHELPTHHRALVLEDREAGFQVKQVSTPRPTHGSTVVRILSAAVLSYHREVYTGERPYAHPLPLVGGLSAVARVVAPGPDTALLEPGKLVYVDCVIHGRDDPSATFLSAIHEGGSPGSKKLMRDVWRDGNFAEYANVPLENCIPLDEAKLCKKLGYTHQDLMYLSYLLVPYGGLRDIGVQPGDTVTIFPATGGFGGAGVQVAVAMGAKVIAMGRNEQGLARLREHVRSRTPNAVVETVQTTGDEGKDAEALQAVGPIDAILDLTPPAAAKSPHLKSAATALRKGGRMSLMGFGDFSISGWKVISDDITMKGKLMYSREDMVQFVKMLENGAFPKGADLVDVKTFALEEWKEAFDAAAEYMGIGRLVTLVP